MANTSFQNTSLSIPAGQPLNLNIGARCPGATRFKVVRTSRTYPASILPTGLSFNEANGVLSGTPTQTGVTILKVRGFRGSRDPEGSWTARKAGCLVSERFDTDVITPYGNSRNSWDATIFRSGTHSLRQFKNANESHASGPVAAWDWPLRVAQPLVTNPNSGLKNCYADATGFAPGEEFFFAFQAYTDANYARVDWPPDPKIVIIDGIPYLSNLSQHPTANDWEIVLVTRDNAPYGYFNSPQGPGWNQFETLPNSDLNHQPAVVMPARVLNGSSPGLATGAGPNWTSGQQQRAQYGQLYSQRNSGFPDGRPDPLSATPGWDIDSWHSVLVHAKVGSGTVSASPYVGGMLAFNTPGFLKVYIAPDGQDYVKVFDEAIRTHVSNSASPWFDRGGGAPLWTTTFPGVRFTPLVFGNDLVGIPATFMCLDELLSTMNVNGIPAADFDGTGNYRSADTLVTLKVV